MRNLFFGLCLFVFYSVVGVYVSSTKSVPTAGDVFTEVFLFSSLSFLVIVLSLYFSQLLVGLTKDKRGYKAITEIRENLAHVAATFAYVMYYFSLISGLTAGYFVYLLKPALSNLLYEVNGFDGLSVPALFIALAFFILAEFCEEFGRVGSEQLTVILSSLLDASKFERGLAASLSIAGLALTVGMAVYLGQEIGLETFTVVGMAGIAAIPIIKK